MLSLARLQQDRGDLEQALELMGVRSKRTGKRAVHHSRSPRMLKEIAAAYLLQGDLDASLESLQEALRLCETFEAGPFAKTLGNIGWLYQERGEIERGPEEYLSRSFDVRAKHAA